ncbi:pilus assembly protein TadG-related protein [Nocardioides sp. C4-1]|uniref:pilus assembly protein TadG-related protein n=1 Tax=Nocardioides sp. C4-1 TaxID=3151851 RepID=UPI0032634748
MTTLRVTRRRLRRRARPRVRDERGAVALTVGLLSIVLVLIAAVVVDLGMQRVARSDMQSVADVVALDLSRELDGRTVGELTGATPSIRTLAEQSRDRNAATIGETPEIAVQLGDVGADGRFIELVDRAASPTAVRVTASTDVSFAFVSGSGGASRSAVAAATSFACYKIGSWAAQVNTHRSVLLDPVLRQMAMATGAFSNGGTVSALSYTGLANTKLDLEALAVALDLASVDELASAKVSLRRLFVAAQAVAKPRPSAAVNILGALASTASPTVTVDLARVLAADVGSSLLTGAAIDALDLVGGSIALLHGSRVANIYLGATLPSLTSAGLTVSLLQGPRQYCGRPGSDEATGVRSDTEQLTVRVGGQLAPTTLDFVPRLVTGLLGPASLARITAENYATFDLGVAGTSSRLDSVRCGARQGVVLDVENGLANLTISTPLRAEVRAKLTVLSALGVPSLVDAVIRINAGVTVKAVVGGSSRADVEVMVPPRSFDTPYPTGSGTVSITSVTRSYGNVNANVELLGGLLGANIALNATQQTQLLDSILDSGMAALLSPTAPYSLATTVIEPLLGLVGARVGGSDVILDGVPALSCSRPRLVG